MSTAKKTGLKTIAKEMFSHLVALVAAIIGLAAVFAAVFAAVVAVSVATATPSHTPVPPAGHVSYNAHPANLVVPGTPSLHVREANNVAFVSWSDPGAVGVSKVTVHVFTVNTCLAEVSTFYQNANLKYLAVKNIDGATYQPVLGRKNVGNDWWIYDPGNPYSATITVTNAAGTSQSSACVAFTAPQTDPH